MSIIDIVKRRTLWWVWKKIKFDLFKFDQPEHQLLCIRPIQLELVFLNRLSQTIIFNKFVELLKVVSFWTFDGNVRLCRQKTSNRLSGISSLISLVQITKIHFVNSPDSQKYQHALLTRNFLRSQLTDINLSYVKIENENYYKLVSNFIFDLECFVQFEIR